MRISTHSFYQLNLNAINSQQQALFRVQQQLATNSKFLTAGDDPVAAARSLGVSQTLSESSQYAASRSSASLSLGREENALDSVKDVLQNVMLLTVHAGDGTMSDADRASLATEMQANLDSLVGLGNTDDGNGQFLFAGFKSGSAPFLSLPGGGVQFTGDQGQRLMQVDVARQMSTSDDGRTVFQTVQGGAGYVTSDGAANTGSGVFGSVGITDATNPDYGKDFSISFLGGNYTVVTKDTPPVTVATGAYTAGTPITFGGLSINIKGTPADGDTFQVSTAKNAGTDVFSSISDLINVLRTPLAGGGDAAQAKLLNALSTAHVKVSNAHDNVLTVLSSVGSRMNEIDSLNTGGNSRDLMDQSYLSQIQDLDPTAAISEFYERQTNLQAAQMTFAKLTNIALFNYL